MERVYLIRCLFPTYAVHGSQGYGHTVGKVLNPFDLDNTRKSLKNDRLKPVWLLQINTIAQNLARYEMRPDTWSTYVEETLARRSRTVASLEQLRQGLKKYLQRGGRIHIYSDGIDRVQWVRCRAELRFPSPLPKGAVDPWGFAREGHTDAPRNPTSWSGQDEGHDQLVPRAILANTYRPYLRAEHDVASVLSNFFEQSPHVMATNFHMSRIKPHLTTKRDRARKILQERGIQTDWANLTTHNLFEAQQRLTHYQKQFRTLFGRLADADALAALEQHERDMLAQVWQLWFFYAQQPDQAWASPVSQVRAQLTSTWRQVEQQVQAALVAVSTDGTTATILKQDGDWEGKPALWIRLDIAHALHFYTSIDKLIHALRAEVGQVTWHELRSYGIREHAEHTIIIPVLRGRMLNLLIWRLHTISGVLSDRKIEEHLSLFVPRVLPRDVQEALGLHLWELDGITQANGLSEAVSIAAMLAARLSELQHVPDITEPGVDVAQAHIDAQASVFSEVLQQALDAATALLDRFKALPAEEQQQREELRIAINSLIETYQRLLPSEQFEGEQLLRIDQMHAYAQRLEVARLEAEDIKLRWIADVLEHGDEV
jgi:hypothetical protein